LPKYVYFAAGRLAKGRRLHFGIKIVKWDFAWRNVSELIIFRPFFLMQEVEILKMRTVM
jgi:hypothetical protein